MKNLLATLILFLSFCSITQSKELSISAIDSTFKPRLVVYVNQPLGWIGKNRFRIGYQNKKMDSYLLNVVIHHYHSFLPFFNEYQNDGVQVSLSYQKHLVDELFLYGTVGYGEFKSQTKSLKLFSGFSEYKPGNGNYLIVGAGISQELNLIKSGKFTIQFTEGLKYAHLTYENGYHENGSFRSPFSPASLLDFTINFGLKF